MSAVLRAIDVTRVYSGDGRTVRALDGVSLDVHPGELIAITGRSGSGKTTFLNLLGGLDKPTSGEIWLENTNLATASDEELTRLRRGRIGYIFQSFGLLPMLSAEENVMLPLRIGGVGGAERSKRAAAALESVGISGRARHRPDELSGGEQQRVAIARALAINPRLILADEPTAELDSTNARAVFLMLREIVDRGDAALVVATHDTSLLALATRGIALRDGQLHDQ